MKKHLLKEIIDNKQSFEYFHFFSTLYMASILSSLIVSARLTPIHIPFTHFVVLCTAATWVTPVTFFIQDITTEVYGYAKSKELVFFIIPIVIFCIGYLKCTTFFPIPATSNINDSYNIVINALPRHLFALLAAITMGSLVNNYLLAQLKKYFKGKYLPLRFVGATAIGEATLQFVWTSIAWIGNLSFFSEIIPFIIFSYCYKVAFEAFMRPVNVYLCNWLKKAEKIKEGDF